MKYADKTLKEPKIFTTPMIIVTEFTKTVLNGAFSILRNTALKY